VTVTSLTSNWDAADISQAITGGPFAFRYGAFYKSRGGAATADELIGYVDFGAQSVTDATLAITLTNQLGITARVARGDGRGGGGAEAAAGRAGRGGRARAGRSAAVRHRPADAGAGA
jgi:hypothetical protein